MRIIIINCFDTYEPRVNLLLRILKEHRHEVTVITSDYRHREKIKRTEKKEDFVFLEAIPYRKNLSYKRIYSHICFSKDVFSYLEGDTTEPDLLWIMIPPNNLAKEAAAYKLRHPGTKIVFDLIDLWPETMPMGKIKGFFPMNIWKKLRDNSFISADYIVTECHLYQERLEKVLRGKPSATLYLTRPDAEFDSETSLPADRISLCYLGSVNNIIDIEVIGMLIGKMAEHTKVTIHIIGDGENRDKLIQTCKRKGAETIYHGIIYDREQKRQIMRECHYGLNIMKPSVCVGLTMKSIDYLEFGVPILNNIKGDTWDIVEREGIGYNLSDETDYAGLIRYDGQKRANARAFFEANLTEKEFDQKVIQIISEC